MRNVLHDDRIIEALIEWLDENGKEIKEHLTPCYCDMRIVADDGNTYKFRLYARCEDASNS